MMLVLTRKHGETLVFTHTDGTRVEVLVSHCNKGRAVLKISAPPSVRILRKEIEEREPAR